MKTPVYLQSVRATNDRDKSVSEKNVLTCSPTVLPLIYIKNGDICVKNQL